MGHYLSFVVFATAIALAPGPDSFLTLRNTVLGGRDHGAWTATGITVAGIIQGTLAALGLGAVIARSEVVFESIRWMGIAYLTYLGVMALRAARRGHGLDWASVPAVRTSRRKALRQGFLCNITNPKVLAFNLAVLPQFAGSGTDPATLLAYALTLSVVGLAVLVAIVAGAASARNLLQRKRIQRGIEAGTGTVMLAFAAALLHEA